MVTEAPAGALTIETFSDQVYFTPLNVTATSGKVALFVTNTRAGAEFSRLAHNLKLGPGVGEALTGTPALVPGSAVLLTIDALAAGEYAFWCTVDEHYKAGMVGTLTVTP